MSANPTPLERQVSLPAATGIATDARPVAAVANPGRRSPGRLAGQILRWTLLIAFSVLVFATFVYLIGNRGLDWGPLRRERPLGEEGPTSIASVGRIRARRSRAAVCACSNCAP